MPKIAAEVDDMAMVRLLAREGVGLAVAPAVVLADEIDQGILHLAPFALSITESFYAITARRSFPHPSLGKLLGSRRRTVVSIRAAHGRVLPTPLAQARIARASTAWQSTSTAWIVGSYSTSSLSL